MILDQRVLASLMGSETALFTRLALFFLSRDLRISLRNPAATLLLSIQVSGGVSFECKVVVVAVTSVKLFGYLPVFCRLTFFLYCLQNLPPDSAASPLLPLLAHLLNEDRASARVRAANELVVEQVGIFFLKIYMISL